MIHRGLGPNLDVPQISFRNVYHLFVLLWGMDNRKKQWSDCAIHRVWNTMRPKTLHVPLVDSRPIVEMVVDSVPPTNHPNSNIHQRNVNCFLPIH